MPHDYRWQRSERYQIVIEFCITTSSQGTARTKAASEYRAPDPERTIATADTPVSWRVGVLGYEPVDRTQDDTIARLHLTAHVRHSFVSSFSIDVSSSRSIPSGAVLNSVLSMLLGQLVIRVYTRPGLTFLSPLVPLWSCCFSCVHTPAKRVHTRYRRRSSLPVPRPACGPVFLRCIVTYFFYLIYCLFFRSLILVVLHIFRSAFVSFIFPPDVSCGETRLPFGSLTFALRNSSRGELSVRSDMRAGARVRYTECGLCVCVCTGLSTWPGVFRYRRSPPISRPGKHERLNEIMLLRSTGQLHPFESLAECTRTFRVRYTQCTPSRLAVDFLS